jgi:hypothetical protein
VLEDGDEVLTQTKRVPQEIGTLTTAVERFDATQQRSVRLCARTTAPCRVQSQQVLARSSDDLNLVGMAGRAAAKHRVERVALDRPVSSVRDRQDVPYDPLGRHAARSPLCVCEQSLMGLALCHGLAILTILLTLPLADLTVFNASVSQSIISEGRGPGLALSDGLPATPSLDHVRRRLHEAPPPA